ncbi:DUF397 domain-containing protein [Actinomadura rupiterrae]|uniref:DUF397 domain-containing protein n=1 Tax=Actinomadura rupiterrae TaxID=559627 RepID=UPI0020A29E6A|nr:DUF397 domain-containing protein [Actinomadura rupiterrae]MCP2336031.1 hypothetical protein [Actinomadura rupiterrae]
MARWRKSSYSEGSANGACVELGDLERGRVGVRDSKAPEAGHLAFSTVELAGLLARIQRGSVEAPSR